MQKRKYEAVVRWPQSLQANWEWEIYRDGLPLPARLRKVGFRSERDARAAGTLALREFLRALRDEKQWGTDAASQSLFEGLGSSQKFRRRSAMKRAKVPHWLP
jgi:hypothetical protein